jgi:hypothetical protein
MVVHTKFNLESKSILYGHINNFLKVSLPSLLAAVMVDIALISHLFLMTSYCTVYIHESPQPAEPTQLKLSKLNNIHEYISLSITIFSDYTVKIFAERVYF